MKIIYYNPKLNLMFFWQPKYSTDSRQQKSKIFAMGYIQSPRALNQNPEKKKEFLKWNVCFNFSGFWQRLWAFFLEFFQCKALFSEGLKKAFYTLFLTHFFWYKHFISLDFDNIYEFILGYFDRRIYGFINY